MKKNYKILIIVFFIGFFACSQYNKLGNLNFANIYDEKPKNLNPEYSVFHLNDSISILYCKIYMPELLYLKPENKDSSIAKFKIKYVLYKSYQSKDILDSNSLFKIDVKNYGLKNNLIIPINFNAKMPGNYLLKTTFFDLNKNKSTSSYLNINKENSFSSQNFQIIDDKNKMLFKTYVSSLQKIRIKSNNSNTKKLYVNYYFRDFPIADPPYVLSRNSSFNYKPDSSFTLNLTNNKTELFQLDKKGFYFFQSDTLQKKGISVFVYYDGFPKISNSFQMLYALRYLVTKREYDKMFMSKNTKRAVDEFWIENSGNPDRARVMIKKYYNRVQNVNHMFSSYLEGWKTDRGMIYIVYGHPNVVYRGTNYENWIYGEAGNMLSVNFRFLKVNNPFSDNDYILTGKSQVYKDSWYNAVDVWRR